MCLSGLAIYTDFSFVELFVKPDSLLLEDQRSQASSEGHNQRSLRFKIAGPGALKVLLWNPAPQALPEPNDFDAWSSEYLMRVKFGAPNEMLWSPGAPMPRSPGALNPFGTLSTQFHQSLPCNILRERAVHVHFSCYSFLALFDMGSDILCSVSLFLGGGGGGSTQVGFGWVCATQTSKCRPRFRNDLFENKNCKRTCLTVTIHCIVCLCGSITGSEKHRQLCCSSRYVLHL